MMLKAVETRREACQILQIMKMMEWLGLSERRLGLRWVDLRFGQAAAGNGVGRLK